MQNQAVLKLIESNVDLQSMINERSILQYQREITNVALAEPAKRGGRYSKKEHEERKLLVYDLHFEQKKSAVEISKILNVNRNTINEDVKFWYSQIENETNPEENISKLTKQIQRIQIQRDRLLENLELIEDIDDKIKCEKLISNIDDKLYRHYSKITLSKKENIESKHFEEIDENIIKDFVRELILTDENPYSKDEYSEEELKFNFIKETKCDIFYVERVIEKMIQLGLNLCKLSESMNVLNFNQKYFSDHSAKYNMARFASLRKYMTRDELVEVKDKRAKIREEMLLEEKQLETKFVKKYGPREKWSEEIYAKFENFEDPQIFKKTTSWYVTTIEFFVYH